MSLNVLALQWDLAWEDRDANFATVLRLLAAANPAPGTLVALPELFATGFSMAPEASEPEEGPTERFLRRTAQRFGIGLIGGLAAGGQNRALAFGPDGACLARYAKQRPFVPGGETYLPGETPVAFAWAGATVAPLICYDLRFPELFRAAAARWRPEVFIVIASWPVARTHHWLRLLAARAIENQAYVVGVNRAGTDPFFSYPGRSVVIDPHGEILADAGAEEGTASAAIDLSGLADYRRRLPFLETLASTAA